MMQEIERNGTKW